jgi:hypothetical protein
VVAGSENGQVTPIAPVPTREEAAAIIAALERFMRATARGTGTGDGSASDDGWRETALREAVERLPEENLDDPWINP